MRSEKESVKKSILCIVHGERIISEFITVPCVCIGKSYLWGTSRVPHE